MSSSNDTVSALAPPISRAGRYVILLFAFLGWGFCGVHMSITGIVMRDASADLLATQFAEQGISDVVPEAAVVAPALLEGFDDDRNGSLDRAERGSARRAILGQWFGWLTCALLLGAAAGGYLVGLLGDRIGRSKAMAVSMFCLGVFSLATYYAQSPTQLLLLRFLTCLGIGGMWPNGIALLSEAWPNISRPFLAGAIGAAANVGILSFGLVTYVYVVTDESWRWTFLLGAIPVVLGMFSLWLVPESPRWTALRKKHAAGSDAETPQAAKVGLAEVFRPPILRFTILGILLGTVPLFGGWGVSNWAVAWASDVGATQDKDAALKSLTVVVRSFPGSITSLLGGMLAFWLGRRRCYFLLSLGALICTQLLFRTDPADDRVLFAITLFGHDIQFTRFLAWTAALGTFNGFFFGWLPYCLPGLFPTRVRATGAGVSFNWGRILTAIGVLVTAAILKEKLKGQYDLVGQYTGLIFVFGMIVVWFIPATDKDLDE
jgi:SHS family sialic acid transporter-like MFS transporter